MSGTTNYKNIINTFVGNGKAYTLDVKNRLKNLFLYNNMGLVEEFMHSRNYVNGTLGATTTSLVGIPYSLIDRLSTKYTTLKNSISAETTSIQTTFNAFSPTNDEKLYIKTTLNDLLDKQYTNINNEILQVVNNLRNLQHDLTTTGDKLNFITNNSYDGHFLNTFGGRITALQLTSTTIVTSLKTSYDEDSADIGNFITNYINPTFAKGYPSDEEYIFFSNQMYTSNSLSFNFGGNYRTELKELLRYRSSNLYDKLLKIDDTGVNGIKQIRKTAFQFGLNIIINPWINYDIKLMKPRITNTIEYGYDILDTQLTEYVSDFNIEYGTNTGATAENLVRNNLQDRQRGVVDNKFNFKLETQLYIS